MSRTATIPISDRSTDILQTLLDAARECVIVVDGDMRVSNCNVPAAVTFGREGIEIEGRRLSEIIRDLDLHEGFRVALTHGRASDVRLELTRAGRRKFDVHVAPLELGGEQKAIGFFYETTQLDRLESIRQEFLSNISHELRTPLTSIMAFVETLEDGAIDDVEHNRHFLSIIRRNAERMSTLIADILELSMIESGNVSVDIRDADLYAAVSEALTSLSSKAESRSVVLENVIPEGTTISADSVRLGQILTNLIDNAIKFNREGGSVTVKHERVDNTDRILDRILVIDTGDGIAPEHAARIFERFYRTDRARSRDLGGTGLGLAIVKHLAKLHGGEVSVLSTPGLGTTFQVTLPAR